ncbi:MAG: cation-transporting P-type ATPase [Tannerellaceae bacterium]|nr:cation-transporting P-type ATPase [Tannerellaceae bacterium]
MEDYTPYKDKWYTMPSGEVIELLHTDSQNGLTEEEAARRLEEYGLNELPHKNKENLFLRFLSYFNDVLIYVLLVAALITAFLGHYTDTIIIVLVAFINALIGFIQENKAERALDKIKNLLSLKTIVIRGGKKVEIDSTDLTLGDIVTLNPGDKVPADLRLVKTNNLKIEESMLTGESVPSDKFIETVGEDTPLGDQDNMAFSSTTVTSGTGTGVVTSIGSDTELGRINRLISETPSITTPLLQQTNKLGKVISIAIVAISVLVFLFGYFFRDYPAGELLLSVIGLAVAAIPEGLPAILSIILAIGVQNMAKRNAIIRNLPSVETLGAVSVICSDKTGTLTKNEMTVQTLITKDNEYQVTGSGYAPEGEIEQDGVPVDVNENEVLANLINCFEYCNDATIGQDEAGNWKVNGDPTEGALITLYEKANLTDRDVERIAEIPFDSSYKYMAVLARLCERKVIFIKGAPDRLIRLAQQEKNDDGLDEFDCGYWYNTINELAQRGQRLIGAAYKEVDPSQNTLEMNDLCEGIIFLGIAGIIDPPRPEATEAIRACKNAGINVKMITGDHIETAKAIGAQMGIGDGKHALEGRDLQKKTDEELREIVKDCDIFARTSPEHKLRLVNALQSDGYICAMTGDGVNDAPALKKADVGIAMGIKGTEVTKDAAEMVLADDNFSTIVAAVEEGRRVYDNLKKTILFTLPTNGAESFLIIASILFGTVMPLTPVQILWVNMVTSVTISFALAFEKIEPDAMMRPPRSPKTPLLTGYFLWRILFVSVIIGGGALLVCLYLLNKGFDTQLVKTITLSTIAIPQMFYLFNSRNVRHFAINKDFFSNKVAFIVCAALILLQLAITYLPFMNRIFGTVPMEASDWIYPFGLGIVVFILVEIEKAIANMIRRKHHTTEL